MNEDDKKAIIQSLNLRIGGDINDLASAYDIETELVNKRERLQSSVSITYLLLTTFIINRNFLLQ